MATLSNSVATFFPKGRKIKIVERNGGVIVGTIDVTRDNGSDYISLDSVINDQASDVQKVYVKLDSIVYVEFL